MYGRFSMLWNYRDQEEDKAYTITMRRIILFISLLLSTFILKAQEEQEKEDDVKSKYSMFSEKSGMLLKHEYYDLGKVGGLTLEAIVSTDVNDDTKVAAVRFKNSYYISMNAGSIYYISALDSEELDSCIDALGFMIAMSESKVPDIYTEYRYISVEGIKISLFTNNGSWNASVQTKKYTDKSWIKIPANKLREIIDKLNRAKSIIEESVSEQVQNIETTE